MELRQLHYFLAVCTWGSLRKASASLGKKESTVSRAIRNLEDELGASLLHRRNNGVSLTMAGERFLLATQNILNEIDCGIHDVRAIGCCEGGFLKIGVPAAFATGFLASLIRRFEKEHRGVRIDVVEAHPSEFFAAISNLQLDVAFVAGQLEWPNCGKSPLWNEQIYAAVPAGHVLAARTKLDLSSLADECILVSTSGPGSEIHTQLIEQLSSLGHRPTIKQQRLSRENVISLVALGHGLMFTSETSTNSHTPGVVFRPIIGQVMSFNAVWSVENDNPALRRLLSMARQMSATTTP